MSARIPFTLGGKPIRDGDVEVLWEGRSSGDQHAYAALLDVPLGGYVFVGTDRPFTGRASIDSDDVYGFDTVHIELDRPAATEMAAVLVSTLLVRSNGLIDWFVEQRRSKAVAE